MATQQSDKKINRTRMAILTLLLTVGYFSSCAQSDKFNFGIQSSFYLSQIEGDNLIGFDRLSFGVGLLGGYNFTDKSELLVAGLYENIGSDKSGAKTTGLTEKSLAQVNLKMICLHIAYSKKFGDAWDGEHKYRYTAGIKLNNILVQNSRLFTNKLEVNPVFSDNDFKKRYLSLRIGIGLIILKNTVLDLVYDHALQSILSSDNNVDVNKLVPFYIGLNLSHYL